MRKRGLRQVVNLLRGRNASTVWATDVLRRHVSLHLSSGRTRCPSPQPPSLLSTMCAVCTHTSPQAVSWPAPPRFSPESPSSSRWGGAGTGASWCLPASGLLPVGRPLPSEPDEKERAPGVLSTAPGSAGQGRARRSPGFLRRPSATWFPAGRA